jgi:hypothetical protein
VDRLDILDQEGQKRDWDWLVDQFGPLQVERVEVPEGVSKVYRVVKLQSVEGPAVQVVTVSDPDGNGLKGVRVVRHWPDAPDLPAWSPPVSIWHREGVFGATNADGHIGFGMGQGDYYFPPHSGASSLWVADEAGPSDSISGLGMLGGTRHDHLDVTFQLMEVEQPQPEKPPAGPPAEPPAVPEEPPPEPPEGPPAPLPEAPPEGAPPETPVQPAVDRWQILMEKLDLIIAMLEERTE